MIATKVERPKLFTVDRRREYYHRTAADAYMDQQDARVRELEEALRIAVFWVSTWSEDYQRIMAALGEKNV